MMIEGTKERSSVGFTESMDKRKSSCSWYSAAALGVRSWIRKRKENRNGLWAIYLVCCQVWPVVEQEVFT